MCDCGSVFVLCAANESDLAAAQLCDITLADVALAHDLAGTLPGSGAGRRRRPDGRGGRSARKTEGAPGLSPNGSAIWLAPPDIRALEVCRWNWKYGAVGSKIPRSVVFTALRMNSMDWLTCYED